MRNAAAFDCSHAIRTTADAGASPGILPVEQPSQRHHREPRRFLGTARRLLTFDEECELLSEKEILLSESTLRTDEIPSERDGVEDNGHNIREQSQERAFFSTWGRGVYS